MLGVTYVHDDELLYRRIPDRPDNYKLEPDGTYRVTSAAFGDGPSDKQGPRQPSVYRAQLCEFKPEDISIDPTEFVVSLTARAVRDIGTAERPTDVIADPTEDHPVPAVNCAHALIIATPPYMNRDPKFKKLRQQLAKAANSNWVIGPPQ